MLPQRSDDALLFARRPDSRGRRFSPGWFALVVGSGLLTVARPAEAIRPFVTDDARVVGDRLAQLETWALMDRNVIEHNVLTAIGPTDWLELTAGFIHGGVHSGQGRGYSFSGPILQGKMLVIPARNNGWPGVALVSGILPPFGYGPFTPPGLAGFSFLAVTESLDEERVLLHANVGLAAGDEGKDARSFLGSSRRVRALFTAGFGSQVRVLGGLHGVAEVYHGDPYDPRSDFTAAQAGFRYIFNDRIQMDGTLGRSLSSAGEFEGHSQTSWATLGLRLVSPELW